MPDLLQQMCACQTRQCEAIAYVPLRLLDVSARAVIAGCVRDERQQLRDQAHQWAM